MSSFKQQIIFRFRRLPWLYDPMRAVYRGVTNCALGLCRALLPTGPRFGLPKGFFSDYELLQKKAVNGRILLQSQSLPNIVPGGVRHACNPTHDVFQPWPIFWTQHDQARLIGSTLVVMDEQNRLCREGAFGAALAKGHKAPRVQHAPENDPAYRSLIRPEATVLKGNWTSLLSRWGADAGYYHWFMDALPRLSMLPDLPADTQVIVPPRLASFQWETLRWLGLEKRVRQTPEKHLLVEHYYFCSMTSMTNFYNPFAVDFLRRSFLNQADLSYDPPRRFYLRRVGKVRPILNEKEVLDLFERKGWAIVDTEALTQARQIRLFSQAEMICAPHGAGLTNLLWCQPGCKVLELCPTTYLNGIFEDIAECVKADHRTLIVEADNAYRTTVDVKQIETALQSF